MNAAPSTFIPINDLRRYSQEVIGRLLPEAERVLASGHFVLGPAVRRFESEFAAYCGVARCVGVANGTDALELGLRALGVVAGDHVLLAANAAMYGTSAVLAIGADGCGKRAAFSATAGWYLPDGPVQTGQSARIPAQ